jgi:hypothetical protein
MVRMPKLVVNNASMNCDQGTSPASLTVTPPTNADNEKNEAATVDHYLPMVNIAAFGMCRTQANPQVAAATAAAQGVLTPQPCIPVTTAAWSPGASAVTIGGVKALTDDSTCKCNWTGTVSIVKAGSDIDVE